MIRTHTAGLTRPGNTTQYAANDVITAGTAAALRFGSAPAGRIRSAVLVTSAYQTTKLDADLMLFDAPITPAADNAAFVPTDAEMATFVGAVVFAGSATKPGNAGAGADGSGCVTVGGLDIAFSSATGILYGVLVARNAYDPVSGEVVTVRLGVEY